SRSAEPIAMVKGGGFDPAPGRDIPEQVTGGCVDDRCALARLDLEVVPVGVMMDHDGGDRYGLRLAGLDVSRQDLVARLEVGDGDRSAGGQQHLGVCGKRLSGAGVVILQPSEDLPRSESPFAGLPLVTVIAIQVDTGRDALADART